MNLHTPRKRKLREISTAIDEDSSSDTEVEEDTINWQEEDIEIGPTPQKHGRIIGLFDNLSPVKSEDPLSLDALHYAPKTSTTTRTMRQDIDPSRLAAGPTSQTRRKVATKSPLKTPSFLKRHVMTFDDSGATASRPRLLFHEAPKRGLSLLISELRELEDNEEDEGMNVLREMESDHPGMICPDDRDDAINTATATTNPLDVEGGCGKKAEVEGDAEKVKWKKKGLKRSHRRVIMRPTTVKKKVADAMLHGETARGDIAGDDSDEYINSEDEAADEQASLGLKPPLATAGTGVVDSSSATAKLTPATTVVVGDGAERPTRAKKAGGISQNYKSLKLRNTGAKGGSRFGRGKFGGGRR